VCNTLYAFLQGGPDLGAGPQFMARCSWGLGFLEKVLPE